MIQRLWGYVATRADADTMVHRPEIGFWDHAGYLMRRFPIDTESVLDIGIWSGWLGALTKCVWHKTAIGVEIFDPYIEKAWPFYDEIVKANASYGLPMFPDGSVDVVCCLNTIEHFSDPYFVLSEMERVARKAVFVSSTNFFMESISWDGNDAQLHKTLITSKDMKHKGYTVRGAGELNKYIGLLARRLPSLDSGYLAYKYLPEHTGWKGVVRETFK